MLDEFYMLFHKSVLLCKKIVIIACQLVYRFIDIEVSDVQFRAHIATGMKKNQKVELTQRS